MRLVPDEEVVEALAADRADEPFHEGILPGCAGGDPNLSNAHARDSLGEPLVVNRISIAQEIPRRRVVRERLDELPSGPESRRMVRDVEVEEFAAVMPEGDEDEEQAEGEGGDNEEVDGDEVSGMSGKKGPPRRGGPRRRPGHVLRHGQLGDGVAEEGEFGVDAPAAPGRIFARQAADELAELGVERRTADQPGAGLPPLVELEALAVPGQDRGGLDDDEGRPPARPDPGQADPEDPVPAREPRSADRTLKHGQLMAQRHVFDGHCRGAARQRPNNAPKTDGQDHRHPRAHDGIRASLPGQGRQGRGSAHSDSSLAESLAGPPGVPDYSPPRPLTGP